MKSIKWRLSILSAAVILSLTASQLMAGQMMQVDKSKVVRPAQQPQQAEQKLSSDPSKLNFGNINVEEVSAYQQIVIVNSGNTAVELGLVLADADKENFKLGSGTCLENKVLQPGESCTVTVAFSPKAAGDKLAKLSRSATPSLLTIHLTGTGVVKQAAAAAPKVKTQSAVKTEATTAQKTTQAATTKPASTAIPPAAVVPHGSVTVPPPPPAGQTTAAPKTIQAATAKPAVQPVSAKAPITEAQIKTMTKAQLEALPDDQMFEFKGRQVTKKLLKQELKAKIAEFRSKAAAAQSSAKPQHTTNMAAMNAQLKQEQKQNMAAIKLQAPSTSARAQAIADIYKQADALKRRAQNAKTEAEQKQIVADADNLVQRIASLDNANIMQRIKK